MPTSTTPWSRLAFLWRESWTLGEWRLTWFLLRLRIRASWARLRGRIVVIDGDYYKISVGDFYANLYRDPRIGKRVCLLQLPETKITKSRAYRDTLLHFRPLSREELFTQSWDGISLREAFKTRFMADACAFDFEPSPLLPTSHVCDLFCRGVATYETMKRVWDAIRPDSVLLFQGAYSGSRLLYELGVRRGQRMVAVENSFLGNRVFLDGTSGMILNRFSVAGDGPVDPDPADVPLAMGYWEDAVRGKIMEHRTEGIHTLEAFHERYGFRLDRPFALLIGQVQVDASMILDSLNYPNAVDFVLAAIQACQAHHIPLVVRFHPKESIPSDRAEYPLDPSYHETLSRLETVPDDVHLIKGREVDTFMLARAATIGLTINSQAGLEMALQGKRVITAGRCFYAGKRITADLQEADDLEGLIARVWAESKASPFDEEIQQRAAGLIVRLVKTCAPRRAVRGDEELIIAQLSGNMGAISGTAPPSQPSSL